MSRLPLLNAGGPAGPSSPDQISGLRLWLKADAIVGLNNNDPVSSWVDSSGVSGNATQATAGLKPTYKTNIINGLPVVGFDGGDALRVASLSLGAFAILGVWKVSGNGLFYEHSPNINAGSRDGTFMYPSTGSTISTARSAQYSSKDLSSNWGSGNVWQIIRHEWNGTHVSHKLFVNNVEQSLSNVSSQNAGSATVTDEFNIGCRDESSVFITGDLAELLCYDGIPSAADVTFLQSYLNQKYGVY